MSNSLKFALCDYTVIITFYMKEKCFKVKNTFIKVISIILNIQV